MLTRRTSALAVMATACLLTASSRADARVVQDERYGFDVTWNAAVRLIRVDMGFSITERDRDTGFVMFSYTDTSGHSTPGSVELIRTRVDGVDGCRVVITVPSMPIYVERHLVSRLERKLHEEYGEPASPPRRAPDQPASPGDGDRDHDRDRDRDRDREHDGDRDRPHSGDGSRGHDDDRGRDDANRDRSHDGNSSNR